MGADRRPIPAWFFVVVVVRRGDRYLLVHERKHGELWYLPAGRVEPGEALVDAARRETLEESGIEIAVDGVIRVEHSPSADATRVRVLFSAHQIGDAPPKSTPDEHSLEARWVTLADLGSLPLRGEEVRDLLCYVDSGPLLAPTWFVTHEGAPFASPRW